MRVLSVRSEKLFYSVCVMVYCLKVIGLAPFYVDTGKSAQINFYDSGLEAFFFSKVGLTYNILLSIPVIVVPAYYQPNLVLILDSTELLTVNILSVITKAETILFISAGYLIIISWALRQRSAASIMNRLLEIDVRLSDLKKRPFNKRALIFLALHIILNFCLWITFWGVLIIHQKVEDLLTEFFARLPGFIVYWFMIEYITVVGLVSRDLETVNKYLLDFKQFGIHLSRPLIRNGIPVIISVTNRSNSQIASLKQLRSVRTTLYQLCEDIADFFSLPILFSIGSCFIPIFERLYRMSQANNKHPTSLTVCVTIIFVLKFIYPIVSLTLNITRSKKEAELTGQIVHKLLAAARTEEIKAELEQFSLQLLHEKVDFTAYGLFTLDSTLLQSMLGGVASYSIILMQFGSSDCNCKKSSAE